MTHQPDFTVDPSAMWDDWRFLCETIGERLAGTAGERQAESYLSEQFEAAGFTTSVERFACTSLRQGEASVSAFDGGRWNAVEACPIVGAPQTPAGRCVEGDIAWLEMPEACVDLAPDSLRGKIAVLFGPMFTETGPYKKLLAARPAAAIHIDERLPFTWVKNDGMYPYWVERYGCPPFVTVPYMQAWEWRQRDVRRLRVGVKLKQRSATSGNVVATLPGKDPQLPAIYLSAHHDTQCDNVGADDNGSGCVTLIHIARALRGTSNRRTIRLISFGAEEQLSVGAAAYVKAHRQECKGIGILFNVDSIASPLGHLLVSHTMGEAPAAWLARYMKRRGLIHQMRLTDTPFMDHFPFAVSGVPTVNFSRGNCSGGRWQHHSEHDHLGNVSTQPVEQVVSCLTPLVHSLANRRDTPLFLRCRPAALDASLRAGGRRYYGWR